jgi:hypothetical protein
MLVSCVCSGLESEYSLSKLRRVTCLYYTTTISKCMVMWSLKLLIHILFHTQNCNNSQYCNNSQNRLQCRV